MLQKMPFLGSERGTEIVEKISVLEGSSASAKDKLNRLYGILSVLDTKSSGLLRVNSLIVTFLLFFITWSHTVSFPERLQKYVDIAYYGAIVLVLSSLACLFVMGVSWKFLGHAKLNNGEYNFDNEILNLARAVDDRTHLYWIAWRLTLLTLITSGILYLGL